MSFLEIQNLGKINVNEGSKVLRVQVDTLEEFKELLDSIYRKENIAFIYCNTESTGIAEAYFNELGIKYVFIYGAGLETISSQAEVSSTESTVSEVTKSRHFVNALLAFILLLGTILPTSSTYATGYFSGSISEQTTAGTGLENVKFNTPTGSKSLVGYFSSIKAKEYTGTGFTLIDPNRVPNKPTMSLESLPSGANEKLITAIISYREKFSLAQIKERTGITATQSQLDSATQLALWLHASAIQVNYQVDVNSITDTVVRSLTTEINTWATQQVSSITEGVAMGDYLFPSQKPALNAAQAKMNKIGDTVEYGPYIINGASGAKYQYGVLGGIVVDSSRNEINSITANQQFYVKFPVSYSGDKIVRAIGKTWVHKLNFGLGRVWLDKTSKNAELQFTLGTATGTNGKIVVNAKDSLTGKAMEGVEVSISTNTPVASITTSTDGSAEYNAPIGKYKLSFTVPEGYLKPAEQEVSISFAGDIQVINLDLAWSQAIVNFYALDAKTLSPAGNSEAFIYDANNKPVKRIGIKQGKVVGVTLPEGEYTLVQYKADGRFAINTGTAFTAVAGKVTEVTITQEPNVFLTTIKVKNSSISTNWVYSIAKDGKNLFNINGTDSLTMPLPNGNYSVLAKKTDGSITAGPVNFSTTLNGETLVELEQEKGTETITFNIVDVKEKKPIPNAVIGLFDEDRNLITYATADEQGVVKFENLIKYRVYNVSLVAGPNSVSGVSATGNRFLGATRAFTLEYYPDKLIKTYTEKDTIHRIPNVTYQGSGYVYPGEEN